MPTLIVDGVELRDRSGGIRLNGTTIEYVERRAYLVDGGSRNVTRAEVLTTAGLPIVGISVLDNGSGAVCSGIEANTIPQNPQYWRVVADFSTQASDQRLADVATPNPNPTSWIPVWRTDYEKMPFESHVDATGKKLVNSAGTPFAGSMTQFRTVTSFTFTQYEADTLTEADIADRNETINESNFRGFPKYTLLLSVVSSDRGYFNAYPARKMTYTLKFYRGAKAGTFKEWNGSSWATAALDAGWRFLAKDVGPEYLSGGAKKPYLIEGHRAIANLDGAGAVVASAGEAAILAFEDHRAIDFNTFLRV